MPGRLACCTAALSLAFVLALPVPAPGMDVIYGEWITPDNGLVRIGPCGEAPCGLLVDFPPPPGFTRETTLDANNRDRKKRDRKLLGIPVLWNLSGNGDDGWRGRAYDPRRGLSASVSATLDPPGRLRLRGCVRVVVDMCRTEVWHRAK